MPIQENESGGVSSAAVIVISLCASCCLILVVAGCTWSWWRRWINRCLGRTSMSSQTSWSHEGNPSQRRDFATLDPNELERQHVDRITIEPFPTLTDLDLDPRQSFELQMTKFPGVTSFTEEHAVKIHDWLLPPHESFPRMDLEFTQVIGKGWFGKVIEAQAKNLPTIPRTKKVIVKRLRENAVGREQTRFLDECRMYRDSDHANILKLVGFAVEAMPFLVMLEYFPLGDLKSYLVAMKKCKEDVRMYKDGVIIRMAKDIAKALEWMFQAGFVHEDLSTRNCLVASVAGKVLIGDYGLSSQKFPKDYHKISNHAVPIRWIAPESVVFAENTFQLVSTTPMSNVYTLGIVLWELFQFGKQPYAEMTDADVIQKVLVTKSYLLEPPEFLYAQDTVKNRLYELMVSCWNAVPENRPTIQTISESLSSP